tara:strand:- start:90 stop:311 length:222 start_codon:yes stop_codon:yes gene_type:complete
MMLHWTEAIDLDLMEEAPPPTKPRERMLYAWRKLDQLTADLAEQNNSERLGRIRGRIEKAQAVGLSILKGGKG